MNQLATPYAIRLNAIQQKIRSLPTMIGTLISFEGKQKGHLREGIKKESGIVVKVNRGRRGTIYSTSNGYKVPEILITDVVIPTQNDVIALTSETKAATGVMDVFAAQQSIMDQMRSLVGHRITWQSDKGRGLMEGTGSRCGKRRLTVVTSSGEHWRVPLHLIRSKDGQPWSYRKPVG